MINQPSYRQTSGQIRAKQAWAAVIEMNNDDARCEYLTLARKLAAMIQGNGLAPTVAFYKSKSSTAHRKIVEHLQRRLNYALRLPENEDIMQFIMNCSTEDLRRATGEAIVYAGWLKRFADARSVDGAPDRWVCREG